MTNTDTAQLQDFRLLAQLVLMAMSASQRLCLLSPSTTSRVVFARWVITVLEGKSSNAKVGPTLLLKVFTYVRLVPLGTTAMIQKALSSLSSALHISTVQPKPQPRSLAQMELTLTLRKLA